MHPLPSCRPSARPRVLLRVLLTLCALAPLPANAQTPAAGQGSREPLAPAPPDGSPHRQGVVRVADGVRVEYLDWGGRGETLVFVAGLGNSAHVFDDLAPRFTDRYRVVGVTRRGFGGSDRPAAGYEVTTLAADLATVLDSLGVRRATLVGHSLGGGEISALAAAHPGRVQRLVYLDSYSFGCRGRAATPPPRPAPAPGKQPAGLFVVEPLRTALTDADRTSVAATRAAYLGKLGWSFPVGELRVQWEEGPAGSRAAGLDEGALVQAVVRGANACQPDVGQPALGIFADISPRWEAFDEQRNPVQLTPEQERVHTQGLLNLVRWDRDRFRAQVPNSRVVLVPGAHHFVFLSHPDRVYQELRAFLEATP